MDPASIEQMNKVRASVGLPPLPVPGKDSGPQFKSADSESEDDDLSTLDKRHAAASGNWQKLEDERLDRLDRQKRKDAAKKARDVAQRNAKLDGKGLGEADDDKELDTRTWLLQQKKRQKKIEQARKLEAELAEREREMAAGYSAKDLAGVKVGHEMQEFDELTGEQILTLKDAEIGEESEEDELENQELRAKEKLDERLKLKMKRPDYDPTEQGEAKAVLSKYDEEIDGKKQKRFTLDGQGTSAEAQRKRVAEDGDIKTNRGIKINLDAFQDDTPVDDYLAPSKVKIKKPKKKKEKTSRQKQTDDDDIFPVQNIDSMDVDEAQTVKSSSKRGLDFDDDALQARLAEQRREALKKRRKVDAAELVRQMGEEMPIDEAEPEGGLLFDETSEFVANLKRPGDTGDEEQAEPDTRRDGASPKDEAVDADGDAEMVGQSYASLQDHKSASREPEPAKAEVTATGLDEEETLSGQGLGASLALLKKRGLIKDDDSNANERTRLRNKFLADKQALIDEFDVRAKEEREAERRSGRWERMSNRERDTFARQQNEAREQYLSRLQAEMFNSQYRPDVKLEYTDEFGRSMNQKEAFKHLSHSFHGKSSGKQKTEKRLKKIADEKKEMAKGMLNVSEGGGMLDVQGREGKRTKQAGVRLQ